MENQKKIFVICGEASGDLHASHLIREIKRLLPDIQVTAVGGNALRAAGAEIFYDSTRIGVFGLFDALKTLPAFIKLQNAVLTKIEQERSSLVILVDFSGFNLRLAKKINNRCPVIYYISPQIWASRKGRIKTIKKYVTKMIVLFEFEKRFYEHYGIDVTFVGHPLLDIAEPSMKKEDFLKELRFSQEITTIALLPGSRRQEIIRLLPLMLTTVDLLVKQIGHAQCIIVESPFVESKLYQTYIQRYPQLSLRVVQGKTYDCLQAADACLVTSGTATLETALLQKPFVTVYTTNLLNFFFYLPQIKVPFITMVNIIANKRIIPEFVQFQATPENLTAELKKILTDPLMVEHMKTEMRNVISLLGRKGASSRAAQCVVDYL